MIDASKLLSRPTSNGLSKDSVQNLVVIKKKVIEVDNLLKERLVLRKVREGILRQQEERERRFASTVHKLGLIYADWLHLIAF